MAQTAMHSGNTHERQPNFRHRKKKENRKIERGEFITPPRPLKHQNAPYLSAVNVQKLKLRRDFILRLCHKPYTGIYKQQ